jgi:hypothetical protein
MTDNVQSILGTRLERLMKEGLNLNTLKAYSYKAMAEHGVNPKNEQAIRAKRAVTETWAEWAEMTSDGIDDLFEACENYEKAKATYGSGHEVTEKAKSICNRIPDNLMEWYDYWDCDAYLAQKMEEHGVDTEDEQAIRAKEAMFDSWRKYMDMAENALESVSNAVENHIKLRKKGNEPTKTD